MEFLKEYFEKVDFEKNQQTTKKHEKFPRMQRVKGLIIFSVLLCSYSAMEKEGSSGGQGIQGY